MLNHTNNSLYLLNIYHRLPISFSHGQGVWLFDNNNKYLDLISSLGVAPLGHNNLDIIQAINQQSKKLIHSSNLTRIEPQEQLSELLVNIFNAPAKVCFNNSGAEAIETAIKLALLYATSRNINNPKIIAMTQAYHGRTSAALSASDNPEIKAGFGELLNNLFIRVPFNDIGAINNLTNSNNKDNKNNIVAILLEPIQGEAGVKVPDPDYLINIRKICDNNNWLMILDEIQTGIGRTGQFFNFQHYNITPDVVALSKGLANGIPIGACIVKEPFADLFTIKSHGSTFGGNHLACSAAIAVINYIFNNNLLPIIKANSEYFLAQLQNNLLDNKHNNIIKNIRDIRGKGLMLGIEFNPDLDCRNIMLIALKHGLLLNVTRKHIIRLLPPLIITKQEIDFAIQQFLAFLKKLRL